MIQAQVLARANAVGGGCRNLRQKLQSTQEGRSLCMNMHGKGGARAKFALHSSRTVVASL